MKPQETFYEKLTSNCKVEFVECWYEEAQISHFWIRSRFEFLLEGLNRVKLPLSESLRVLDVGSGNGVIRIQLESATPWVVDCSDINEDAMRRTPRGRGRNLLYNILDLNSNLIGQYDVVLLMDVLEHIENPSKFIAAALKHLKPDGHLVINVPALQAFFSEYDICAGHFRRYSRASLKGELGNLPIRSVFEGYWGFSLLPLLLIRKFMVRNLKNREQVIRIGFKPRFRFINKLLYGVLAIERRLFGLRLLGSSLIYLGQAQGESSSVAK